MNAFENFPDDARVWIYASNRLLSSQDQELISKQTADFLSTWTAHDNPVEASFAILHDVFLVIMVSEQKHEISGCGIDKSTAFVKSLGQSLQIDFFNRLQIELLHNHQMILTTKSDAIKSIENQTIGMDTLTFNKAIMDKAAFVKGFQIPITKAWFFPSTITQQVAK